MTVFRHLFSWLMIGKVEFGFKKVEGDMEGWGAKRYELEIPLEVDRLVLACLAKNLREGPSSAGDLGKRLEATQSDGSCAPTLTSAEQHPCSPRNHVS